MEFDATSHHITPTVTDADCVICHAEVYLNSNHNSGSSPVVDLRDPDSDAIFTVTRIEGDRATLTASDIATLTTFCQNCHDSDGAARLPNPDNPFGDGSASAVGTHSNEGFDGEELVLDGEKWKGFSVGCVQCHTSHGSSNLALIDSTIVVTPSITSGSVVFTDYIGDDSYDEIDVDDDADDICTTCHTDPSNPNNPMNIHAGGDHTVAGGSDNRETDCRLCHPHEPDDNPLSLNGHMPADSNAVGLHGLLVQSGLWPILGLTGVLLAFVVERRKRSRN